MGARRIGSLLLAAMLAGGGLAACGDDGGNDDEVGLEEIDDSGSSDTTEGDDSNDDSNEDSSDDSSDDTIPSGVFGSEECQEVIEAFFEDLDHSIRELGVGDAAVPKRMKKIGRMFYGRANAYEAALDLGDEAALAAALARNVHPDVAPAPDMTALARHMVSAAAALSAVTLQDIESGDLTFPPPDAGAAA